MDGRRRLVPTVKKKPARKAAKKTAPKRRVTRRQVGAMEQLGAKLDHSGALIAAGAFQFAFLSLIASALIAFLFTVFSGQMSTLPGRLAAMPDQAARSLGANVMRVTIKGNQSLSTREIMGALRDPDAGSVIGRSLITLDPEKLRLAIEELGPVQHASVTKLLPDTVHISVIERTPRALYQDSEGQFFVVDVEGVIIRQTEATRFTDLPVISGTADPAGAMAFFEMLRNYPVLFARTASIEVVADRRVDLRFRNGFLAKMPETEIPTALDRLSSLDAGTGSLAQNLDYIDLRDPDYAYYKPRQANQGRE